jgi:hypothetical protein
MKTDFFLKVRVFVNLVGLASSTYDPNSFKHKLVNMISAVRTLLRGIETAKFSSSGNFEHIGHSIRASPGIIQIKPPFIKFNIQLCDCSILSSKILCRILVLKGHCRVFLVKN